MIFFQILIFNPFDLKFKKSIYLQSIICDTMPGSRASSRRKSSSSKETSIKSFFSKETPSVKDEKTSPSKTSDYESEEGSRSTTPSTDPSRSTTPSSSDLTKDDESRENSQESDVKSEDKEGIAVKREVGDMKQEDDDEMDIFATANEDEDDKINVKAALMTGLLTDDVKKEEERVAEETRRLELQEEAKRKQELAKEQELLSTQQRFDRLQKLLGKSKFYSDFLLNKMKSHEASMELKKQAMEARTKKRAEMSQDAEEETKKGGKRGRGKKDNEGPRSKKIKVGDESVATSDQSEVAKNRNEHHRKFEGKDIPANQPMLLTGGIMRSYQLEGYEWMATLWENGINGILADEMGLGKTIQTVALFCHMYEMGVSGPFLVVAPLSTVPNWVNEFKR